MDSKEAVADSGMADRGPADITVKETDKGLAMDRDLMVKEADSTDRGQDMATDPTETGLSTKATNSAKAEAIIR